MMRKETKTWREAAKAWSRGDSVWSAELGGIGPGYEQAIQVLLWEVLARWKGKAPRRIKNGYPKPYEAHVNEVVRALNDFGFSGTQVGVAKATALQFMWFGYAHMMNKLEDDRHILVSRDFPHVPVKDKSR